MSWVGVESIKKSKVLSRVSWVTWIVTWVRVESARKIWVEHNPDIQYIHILRSFELCTNLYVYIPMSRVCDLRRPGGSATRPKPRGVTSYPSVTWALKEHCPELGLVKIVLCKQMAPFLLVQMQALHEKRSMHCSGVVLRRLLEGLTARVGRFNGSPDVYLLPISVFLSNRVSGILFRVQASNIFYTYIYKQQGCCFVKQVGCAQKGRGGSITTGVFIRTVNFKFAIEGL